MKIYLIAVFISSLTCFGCESNFSDTTPKKYRNNTLVTPQLYKIHKIILHDSIQAFVQKRKLAFYPKENDSLTEVIIDTILYSPQKNKASFFVITKNSNSKLRITENREGFNYNAYCFIASLNIDSQFYNLNWLNASSISHYESLKETSSRIREMYFIDFSKRLDENNMSLYKYNLDDIRFWDGPAWKQFGDEARP